MLLQLSGCQEATDADVQAREGLCYCLISCTAFRLVNGCKGHVFCCVCASLQVADMCIGQQRTLLCSPHSKKAHSRTKKRFLLHS